MTRVLARALFGAIAVLSGASQAFAPADAGKVLRVAFPIAETGFDPRAAGDVYSNHVNRVIFDPPSATTRWRAR